MHHPCFSSLKVFYCVGGFRLFSHLDTHSKIHSDGRHTKWSISTQEKRDGGHDNQPWERMKRESQPCSYELPHSALNQSVEVENTMTSVKNVKLLYQICPLGLALFHEEKGRWGRDQWFNNEVSSFSSGRPIGPPQCLSKTVILDQ